MNNQMPFFGPFNNPYNNQINEKTNFDIEKIINKLNRLEKNIRILENRITKLEGATKNNEKNYYQDDPTDMYII